MYCLAALFFLLKLFSSHIYCIPKIGFVWFQDRPNEIDHGETQVYRFTRHVWGINSCLYIALFAIERLIDGNHTIASQLTLTAIESKRSMGDMLLSHDSLSDLKLVTEESIALFGSRGFKLRKGVANGLSKSVLSSFPSEHVKANIWELDFTSQLTPNSKALGLIRDAKGDRL